MAEYEPYTKEERERLVASMERWNMLGQDRVIEVFAGAVVIEVRRYEATVAALEAEVTRLRQLAEVGEAVEGMPAGYALHHYDDASWLVRESNLSGWEKLPFPPTVTGAMKKAAEEYSYDPTWDAVLRAAKGESCSSDS